MDKTTTIAVFPLAGIAACWWDGHQSRIREPHEVPVRQILTCSRRDVPQWDQGFVLGILAVPAQIHSKHLGWCLAQWRHSVSIFGIYR